MKKNESEKKGKENIRKMKIYEKMKIINKKMKGKKGKENIRKMKIK